MIGFYLIEIFSITCPVIGNGNIGEEWITVFAQQFQVFRINRSSRNTAVSDQFSCEALLQTPRILLRMENNSVGVTVDINETRCDNFPGRIDDTGSGLVNSSDFYNFVTNNGNICTIRCMIVTINDRAVFD